MKTKFLILLVSAVFAVSIPASAHHSFSAVFDANMPVEVSGTVTEVEWMNPHAWIYIDVGSEDGETVNWAFELGSPNGLIRRGWSRKTVQVGDQISVTGYKARDGSSRGNISSIVLADGSELTGNSSRK
jgi:hypothetical protein